MSYENNSWNNDSSNGGYDNNEMNNGYNDDYNNNFNNDFNGYYSQNDFESSYSQPYVDTRSFGARINEAMESSVVTQSFIFMFVALLITAFTSIYVASSPRIMISVLDNFTIFLFAELAVVIIANIVAHKNLLVPSAVLFSAYAIINGITLAPILYVYTGASIGTTFFITAVVFGAMAAYGLVTKKDLTSLGSLCIMALLGIILAGVVNIFLGNTMLDMGISILGIIIFVGLTAYDAQKIKNLSYVCDYDNVTCIALLGAIELYLDFINIFLKLLSLTGKRK